MTKFIIYDARKETLIVAAFSIIISTVSLLHSVKDFLTSPFSNSHFDNDKTKCVVKNYLPDSEEYECFIREFSSVACYKLYALGTITQILLLIVSIKLFYGALMKEPKDFALWISLSSTVVIYYILLGVFRCIIQLYNNKIECTSNSILLLIFVATLMLGTSVYSISVVYCYWMIIIGETLFSSTEDVHDLDNRIFTHAGGVVFDEDPDRIIYTVQAPPSYDQHMAEIRELNKNIPLPAHEAATSVLHTYPPPEYRC